MIRRFPFFTFHFPLFTRLRCRLFGHRWEYLGIGNARPVPYHGLRTFRCRRCREIYIPDMPPPIYNCRCSLVPLSDSPALSEVEGSDPSCLKGTVHD